MEPSRGLLAASAAGAALLGLAAFWPLNGSPGPGDAMDQPLVTATAPAWPTATASAPVTPAVTGSAQPTSQSIPGADPGPASTPALGSPPPAAAAAGAPLPVAGSPATEAGTFPADIADRARTVAARPAPRPARSGSRPGDRGNTPPAAAGEAATGASRQTPTEVRPDHRSPATRLPPDPPTQVRPEVAAGVRAWARSTAQGVVVIGFSTSGSGQLAVTVGVGGQSRSLQLEAGHGGEATFTGLWPLRLPWSVRVRGGDGLDSAAGSVRVR